MIDHIGIRVSDLRASTAFYRAALEPLGYEVLMDFEFGVGLGQDGKPDLWLYPGEPRGVQTHVAIAAPDRHTVDAFHVSALQAGATDTGSPRVRSEYHPNYYGAFVADPDGHNLEAVCHLPP
jgi:catechol 2,3-dioxygenase-like lactoylglutathione lyase family enzyme